MCGLVVGLAAGYGRPLVVRVDRVEQNARANAKLVWCVIGAVVVVAVDRFTGHMAPPTAVVVPQTQNGAK